MQDDSVLDMVETIARRFFESQNDTKGATWESIYPEARAELREFVRFVILAMREPTEAMIHCSPVTKDNFVPYPDTCAVTWRAMIDAALLPTGRGG